LKVQQYVLMNEVEDSYGGVKVTLKLMFNQSVYLCFELLYGLLARFFVSLIICSFSLPCVLSDEYTELTFVMPKPCQYLQIIYKFTLCHFLLQVRVYETYSTQGYSYSRNMQ